jgi:uncharacterized protein (TIGR00369 family)
VTRAHHLAELRRRFQGFGIARLLGMKITALGPGRAVVVLDAGPKHRHPTAVHGGVLATLADTAVALGLYAKLPPGTLIATVEMSINYLTHHQGGLLRARARVLRMGKRWAVGEADIRNRRGELVAKSVLTYSIRRQ